MKIPFDIVKAQQRIKLPNWGDIEYIQYQLDHGLISFTKYFARGSRPRINEELVKESFDVVQVPTTFIDWLKDIIVTLTPSLNFGWLRPKYKSIQTKVYKTYNQEIWNVYPVNPEMEDRGEVLLYSPSPTTWLSSTPCTEAEVQDKYRDILSSDEIAEIMAMWRLK